MDKSLIEQHVLFLSSNYSHCTFIDEPKTTKELFVIKPAAGHHHSLELQANSLPTSNFYHSVVIGQGTSYLLRLSLSLVELLLHEHFIYTILPL